MQIEQLDLETRSKIYNHTKKVLRKYQKGIVTGKLTADKFANNILADGSISSILNEDILNGPDFKLSYTNYIATLITIQNENLSRHKSKKYNVVNDKPDITQKLKLKKLLETTGYTLTIPIEYLNSLDIVNVIKYINTGSIDLGNEHIYNYINKHSAN